MKNPESTSEYYDNLTELYSYAIDLYGTGYEKLRNIKVKSSSYTDFIAESKKTRDSVNDALELYYEEYMKQLQYSIATDLDPFGRVLTSLESKEREVDRAEEKYNWILSDKAHVGNEQSLKFAESAFDLEQSTEEMVRLKELLGE
jgi:hypothetical protein